MDPLLSLAFAVHSTPGVYALLLGSGVSRSAAVPTGWEIVLDLIGKLAAMRGEPCTPDPETWFHAAFGEAPKYSELLKRVCRTPAERQQLLRRYFEPSREEEASGQKQPTKAHHAIAALVKTGHLRVILTTNFDRFIERSLEAAGVSPIIISTPHAVDGALPLTHAACTVVKLHGDYLDTRIRNTPEELGKYDRRFDRLLDRVFDEFGLVVCGWSADWDDALRTALTRCKSRRFTTFWATRGDATDCARRLIDHRRAEVIPIADADRFFSDLHQKVLSLATFDPPHPLSAKTAVATMKRLLSDERHRIDLHDLVTNEVERVVAATSDTRLPVSGSVPCTEPEISRRIREYEATTSILQQLYITGCYWGDAAQHSLWTSGLERLANRESRGGDTLWIALRLYPALLALYAGGIAAIAGSKFNTLRALFLSARVRSRDGDYLGSPAVEELYPQAVIDRDVANSVLMPGNPRYTPVSEHLLSVLREPLRQVLPADDSYEREFDRFEYFLALVYVDTCGDSWAPVGRFGWKGRRSASSGTADHVVQEATSAGADWPPIKAGLFASTERFKASAVAVANAVKGLRWY